MGASGEELPCDVIVAATGYKPIRSFLPADVADQKEKDGFWLYRQMVHPSHPGLIFLNSETTTFTNITTASIQARWLAEMLAGTFELPSAHDMQAQIEEMQEWKRSTMPNAGAARAYMIQTHQVHYYDQLLKDMGASVRRKQGFAAALKEVFDPYRPRDFGSIITGEFKNRPSEQAKPGDAQAPFGWKGLWSLVHSLPSVLSFASCSPEFKLSSLLCADWGSRSQNHGAESSPSKMSTRLMTTSMLIKAPLHSGEPIGRQAVNVSLGLHLHVFL